MFSLPYAQKVFTINQLNFYSGNQVKEFSYSSVLCLHNDSAYPQMI